MHDMCTFFGIQTKTLASQLHRSKALYSLQNNSEKTYKDLNHILYSARDIVQNTKSKITQEANHHRAPHPQSRHPPQLCSLRQF